MKNSDKGSVIKFSVQARGWVLVMVVGITVGVCSRGGEGGRLLEDGGGWDGRWE